MDSFEINKLQNLLLEYPVVRLAYLFGSRARNEHGLLSDYDVAIFLNQAEDRLKIAELKMILQTKIAGLLKTDSVDLVVLNSNIGSELKYNIIKDGKIIFERESARVFIEPQILNEYFDLKELSRRYNLTRT